MLGTMYRHCHLIIAYTGLFLLLSGAIYTIFVLPLIENYLIQKITTLRNGTVGYKSWQITRSKFKVYFFEVLNTENIQSGEKPILKEVGPYVYDELTLKQIIETNETSDTIKYSLKKYFVFNTYESNNRNENDEVTIFNAALLGMISRINQYISNPSLINKEVPFLFSDITDVFIKRTVKEILFDGIELHCDNNQTAHICLILSNYESLLLEKSPDNDMNYLFSIFKHLISTTTYYQINRGIKKPVHAGKIEKYQNKSLLQTWRQTNCNKINGTDFTTFLSTKYDKKHFFKSDMCRSISLYFQKDDLKLHSFNSKKFTVKAETLDPNKENECFCPVLKRKNMNEVHCPLKGIFDLMRCIKFPLLLSYPHFYLGDAQLLKHVDGLNPKKYLHENFAAFEIKTGTPLLVKERWQYNVNCSRFNGIEILGDVSEGIFPLLWVEEELQQSSELISAVDSTLNIINILNILKYLIISCGILVMVLAVFVLLYQEKLICLSKNTKNKSVNQNEEIKLSRNYAHLYPQNENKNFHDGLIKRD